MKKINNELKEQSKFPVRLVLMVGPEGKTYEQSHLTHFFYT
jgi:hypothetical protein